MMRNLFRAPALFKGLELSELCGRFFMSDSSPVSAKVVAWRDGTGEMLPALTFHVASPKTPVRMKMEFSRYMRLVPLARYNTIFCPAFSR